MEKEEPKDTSLVKNFTPENFSFSPKMVGILLALVILGTLGGFAATKFNSQGTKAIPGSEITSN
ncbi:MAG TPA: hypothetical protein VN457_01135, partial [Chlamydiales bacterium]|nr:hypothetical protein [Chlamydiales bacterium]